MTLNKPLIKLIQMAYSAEKAAAYAYIGHAHCVKNKDEKIAIKQIENDEWKHREEMLKLLHLYNIPVSKLFEFRFYIIGKIISAGCYLIGWFMPFYFAGRLESGNVCEYFYMKQQFNSIGITEHDELLYELGVKEKEHEIYFYEQIKNHKWLPFFEKLFSWGALQSFNDVDLNAKATVKDSVKYCKK